MKTEAAAARPDRQKSTEHGQHLCIMLSHPFGFSIIGTTCNEVHRCSPSSTNPGCPKQFDSPLHEDYPNPKRAFLQVHSELTAPESPLHA